MHKNRVLTVIIASLLAGCAYFSEYKKPDVPVNNQWDVPQNTGLSESNLPFVSWWQGFNDPTLNQLIESGLASNNTLNMSRGNVEAAEGELKKVQLQWIPDISVILGYSNNPATGFPGLLAVLAPNYTMNVFSQIKQQKKAKYELAEAKAEDDAVKLNVITQITASYFTYQAEIERKQLLDVLAGDITHLAEIAKKVYKGGLSANISVQDLEAQVNMIRGEQQVIEQNIVVSRNALHYLINQNPGQITTNQKFSMLNNKALAPAQLPMTVLENRPDMQMAENRLRASNEGIGLAASQLLPTVQLDFIGGPVAGNNSYNIPNPITTNVVDFNDELLKIPVLRASVLGEIDKAKGLDKVSYYNYVETLQKVLRDTSNAFSANYRLTNKLTQTESAQIHLAKSYKLNQSLTAKGIQSVMDTLKSKIALDRMDISVNQDKLQQLITIVNLYHELAGGYKAGEDSEKTAESK